MLVLLGGAGAVVVAGLRGAAGIVGPAFLALTIAITIHPLLAWLQRRRVPGWLAVALTMLVAYAALLAMAAALVLSVARLATLLPSYEAQFTSLVDQATGWLGEFGVTQQQLDTAVRRFDLNSLARVLQQVLIGVAGVVSDLGFILVLLFFLIIDSSTSHNGCGPPPPSGPSWWRRCASFARATRQYIVVSTVFGLLVSLVDVAALYWLDVPLPWPGAAGVHHQLHPQHRVRARPDPAGPAGLAGGRGPAGGAGDRRLLGDQPGHPVADPAEGRRGHGGAVDHRDVPVPGVLDLVNGPLGALLAVPLSLLTKALLVDADPASRWLDVLIAPVHRGAQDDPDGER